MLLHFIICLISFPLAIAIGTLQGSTSNAINNIAKPGCPTQCGNVTVPYPFGFGEDPSCSLDDLFHMTCNKSQLFLRKSSVRIHDFSESELRIFSNVSYRCYDQDGLVSVEYSWVLWLKSFTFSEKNKFTVIGCDDYGLIRGTRQLQYSNGCIGLCSNNASDIPAGNCSGNGCCQTSITKGLDYYDIRLNTFSNHKYVWLINKCGYGFLGEEGSFQFRGASDLSNSTDLVQRVESTVTIVLDWVIASNQNCSNASECKANSHCYDVDGVGNNATTDGGGYRCSCNEGYEGNPYLDQGCQDINECNDVKNYPCYGSCVNIMGNYTCNCKGGYYGDPKIKDGCRRKSFSMLRLLLGIGFGFLTVLIGSSIVYYTAKKRKLLMLREKFFEQNGGVLLEDKLKNNGVMGVGSTKIFRVEELKEATHNYAEDMILGKGGNGIVYKGILSDKHVVAIKKSQKLDQGQREQFINEMIILTQINHQNVVQLLGCCLETDVPLLAYEFVSNDTLYHHIHNRTSGMGRLSWDSRLRIAYESAGALAYLHTDARMSIIHRDVKSTNILLDENYTAKIADFGASRLVPLGHHEVVTLVQGTLGYLDPEYFHTGQLTDRSDVYSFGVVLAELLTGKKALGVERCVEDRSLATYFVKAKKANRLTEIIDRQVVMEATDEQLKAACDLVCRCLNQVGGNRPSMKEVTMELERLRKFGKHHWISQDNDNDNERSSLIIESEEFDNYPLVTNSDTFGEYSSSSTRLKTEIMLQVQDPR